MSDIADPRLVIALCGYRDLETEDVRFLLEGLASNEERSIHAVIRSFRKQIYQAGVYAGWDAARSRVDPQSATEKA